MNENVTNKTPKRRRWIARLLVSVLCILLASSLLFVGVVADTITLTAQFSSTYAMAASPKGGFVYPLDATHFVYRSDYMLYINSGSKTLSTFDLRSSSGYNSEYSSAANTTNFFYDGSYLYCLGYYISGGTNKFSFFTITLDEFLFVKGSVVNCSVSKGINFGSYNRSISFTVFEDVVYGFLFSTDSSASTATVKVNPFYLNTSTQSLTLFLSFASNNYVPSVAKYDVFYKNGWIVSSLGSTKFNVLSSSMVPGNAEEFYYFFDYEGDIYAVNSGSLKKWNVDTVSFETVGTGAEGVSFYAENGVFTSFKTTSSYTVPYTVYSGLPTTEPPPESSDETTEEPPPESSDESSEDPVEGGTKIWKVDRGFVESYAGTVDLTDATKIRAFLGVFTSSGSSFASDRAVPLTLEVYRDGSETPDTYTFDFYAYGWGLLGLDGFPNSYDSYTFPDVVGLYYEIPIPSDGEGLLFPTFAPYGSVYVNFSDSVYPDNIQRVTFNLHNSQGYLDVNFASSSSTSFTIYNDDLTKGKTYSFDSGTFNYKCFFDLDGEFSESEWYSPQFGSSIKYFAEDVLESGLYSIYSFNDESIEYPWGNGEWSDIIIGNNSRLEDISADYALLESKANALYGNYKFDPLFGADFNDAVSRFNVVKDSSGGQTVLGFFNGMWSVHPFASSMIAIVGTLAIVGFIVRKL